MKKKYFLLTWEIDEEVMKYMAKNLGLSIQELTDEKLVKILNSDLNQLLMGVSTVTLDLTPRSE